MLNAFNYRTGYYFLQRRILDELSTRLQQYPIKFDIVWVSGGECFGSAILKWLREHLGCKILLYQNDDPTGHREYNHFSSLRTAIPYYDLCVFVRFETTLEALAIGAVRVVRVYPSYDEVVHAMDQHPINLTPQSIISFIGTLIPGEARDRFLVSLLREGLPIRLLGNLWRRSTLWPALKPIFAGPARIGIAYSQAIRNASVSLGLLSHRNRDLTTRRSVEVPACGGLLCAERTSEHQLLYEDGFEASFWASTEECILECKKLLSDSGCRNRIRINGWQHVRRIGVGNEDICRQILALI